MTNMMTLNADGSYTATTGETMRIERLPEYGNIILWVLRDAAGSIVDRYEYKCPLAERNGFYVRD